MGSNKKIAVIGRNGFIGSALMRKFPDAYNYLRKDLDYVFWFAAPSSQILFNYAPTYCYAETLSGFQNVLGFCMENNIKLIYPSTASYGNEYAQCKMDLETLQEQCEYKNVLGLRIYAGYGPLEAHKGEYASVVYQFCKRMKEGKQPIIYGNGKQTRDFVFIDDIVDNIVENIDKTGVIELGTGVNHSFNDIVQIINEELKTDLSPVYITKPESYIEETLCKNPANCKFSLREGIKEVLSGM